VGTALAEAVATPEGLATLQEMTRAWPFFDDLLAKIEMVCAKADLEIARAYAERLGADMALFGRLAEEFDRTVAGLLRIRGTDQLLADTPVLRTAIGLRNPYVDPLSLLQIALLVRRRASEAESGTARTPEPAGEGDWIGEALASTLSGLAQGLRNTG
jgi:phosphoenolpyruvate carboxylase